jgi:hypothetical protein
MAREPQLLIATGEMGVGKSFVTNQLLGPYQQGGRKLLIFDPNNEESYLRYKALYFDILEIQRAKQEEKKRLTRIVTQSEKNIINLPPGCAIRIVPMTIYGDKMTAAQMKLTMITILENFRGGMVLLEDVNKYITNFEQSDVLGAFKAIRHQSQDIIMHMQSLNPLRPIHYEAASVIRLHYDGIDVAKIKTKVADHYTILKISQLIVQKEYLAGNNRFFCYVHLKAKKIKGVTFDQFATACIRYLTTHKAELRDIASEVAFRNKRSSPSHADVSAAMQEWIRQHYYFLPDEQIPKATNRINKL